MLETIRDYARERLEEAGEADALARRHADYHFALLEERPMSLVLGSRRGELLAWFGEEEDNLRATLDYLEGAAPQDAARAADLLMPFWMPRGRLVEGQERLLRLLARSDFAAGTRAMLLTNVSDIELRLGQLDSAEFRAQEAVTLAEESGERRTLAFALQDARQGRLSPGRLRRGDPCPDPRARGDGRRRVDEVDRSGRHGVDSRWRQAVTRRRATCSRRRARGSTR